MTSRHISINDTPCCTEIMSAEFGFLMDNVVELLNYSDTSNQTFDFYPDPMYYPFEDGMKLIDDRVLEILVCTCTSRTARKR